jgi:very-short-patch-repair endonuclease
MAALLACGAGATLSHRSAAAIWGFSTEPGSWVDVTVSGREGGRRGGIRLHRTRSLDTKDVALRSGLPVTRPARTLIDLAATTNGRSLVRLVDEARIAAAVTDEELRTAIRRAPRGPGRSRLSGLMTTEAGPSLTRSEAERRFLALAAAAGLPAPQTNVRVGRHLVDAVWREQRVIVEIDGFAFHGSRAAFERDRRRDAELAALGYRVIRVTWRQLEGEPHAVVARLAGALAAPAPGAGPDARALSEPGPP